MIDLVQRHIIPAAYAVLPSAMTSPEATAMLLAIGLQESSFSYRRQKEKGPARGFWQFERAGIVGVVFAPRTKAPLGHALTTLCYPAVADTRSIQRAIEHNDVLACVLARLLLWTLPQRLPTREQPEEGWAQYLAAWRPGAAKRDPVTHRARWDRHFAEAWALVGPSPAPDAVAKG